MGMPVALDGYVFAALPGALALAALATGHRRLAVVPAGASAFCIWFFRNPERETPAGPVCVSPADGRVVAVRDLGEGWSRISIFLSLFDVHVNRAPIGGTITSIRYQPGRFFVASKDAASAENEQNVITVAGNGTTVVFRQIAGLAARRIVCWKRAADVVAPGERVGLIRFGSRVDVELGPEWEIETAMGQRVRAGTTVIGRRQVAVA
jgi:phosphatidylserine decarboxylase